MDNIFLVGGALLVAHMLTRGGNNALAGAIGGGAGGGFSGMSEEEEDAQAYMRSVRDEKSYENQEGLGSILSGLFDNLFGAVGPNGDSPELSSDEDRGIAVHVNVEAPEIEVAHGNTPQETGGQLDKLFELPSTWEVKETNPIAVGLNYTFEPGVRTVGGKEIVAHTNQRIDPQVNPGEEGLFSWSNQLFVADSNVSTVPFTLAGANTGIRGLEGEAPVTGAELIAASQAGYGNVIEWRNAQDN